VDPGHHSLTRTAGVNIKVCKKKSAELLGTMMTGSGRRSQSESPCGGGKNGTRGRGLSPDIGGGELPSLESIIKKKVVVKRRGKSGWQNRDLWAKTKLGRKEKARTLGLSDNAPYNKSKYLIKEKGELLKMRAVVT